MQIRPTRKKGFIFNEDVAEDLEILNEYRTWEEEYDYTPLIEIFNEKFGVEPEFPKYFDRDYIRDLQGFDWNVTYLLFDSYIEKAYADEWDKFTTSLEEMDIDLIEGSWLEIG